MMSNFKPITVEEFKEFVKKQISDEFYLGHASAFTLGFVNNLNALFEENQNEKLS